MLDLSFPWDLRCNRMQVTDVFKSAPSAELRQAKKVRLCGSASPHRAQLHGEGTGARTCRSHSKAGPGRRCSRAFHSKKDERIISIPQKLWRENYVGGTRNEWINEWSLLLPRRHPARGVRAGRAAVGGRRGRSPARPEQRELPEKSLVVSRKNHDATSPHPLAPQPGAGGRACPPILPPSPAARRPPTRPGLNSGGAGERPTHLGCSTSCTRRALGLSPAMAAPPRARLRRLRRDRGHGAGERRVLPGGSAGGPAPSRPAPPAVLVPGHPAARSALGPLCPGQVGLGSCCDVRRKCLGFSGIPADAPAKCTCSENNKWTVTSLMAWRDGHPCPYVYSGVLFLQLPSQQAASWFLLPSD